MLGILIAILPVFLVVGFGYLAVQQGLFSAEGVDGLMRFAQTFAVPALLFRAMSTLEIGEAFHPALFVSYYAGATLSFLVALIGARWLFRRPWEDSIAIGFCGLFANGLLIGVPVTEQAFGPGSTEGNFAIITVNSLYCYAIGITAMEIARARAHGGTLAQLPRRVLTAMFRNALIVGIMLGLAVNLSGLTLPLFFTDALDLVARTALPAALFGLGGVLCRYRPEGDLRIIAWIMLASLLVHPAVTWTLGATLSLPQDGFRSAVTMAAMAPGLNTYIFANMYGVARRVVASAVLMGTAVSLLSSWVWLSLLQ